MVLAVVTNELNKENVSFLKDTEISPRGLCLIKVFLSDDNHSDLMSLQVPKESLVLLVSLLLIRDNLGVVVLPVSDHLADIVQNCGLRFGTTNFTHFTSALNKLSDLIPSDRLAELIIIREVVGTLGLLDAQIREHIESFHKVARLLKLVLARETEPELSIVSLALHLCQLLLNGLEYGDLEVLLE